ncbi:MAG: peptidoglycan DD-metalloendopeptidase family protein [Lachnospiraceae bacterium]|nr:peptidoglycan DD-metalloendopeptidase family protein [Lachnospiraceae bacterium]
MKYRRWKKRMGAVAVCVCMGLSFCFSASASSLEDAQKKKQKLESSLKEAQETVKELSGSKKDAAQKVEALETELDAMSKRSDELEGKLSDLSGQISDSQAGLKEAQDAADAQYAQMKGRIRYMYENGRSRNLDLIFSSGSFGEFLKAVEYVSSIYSYDREMMEAYIGYQKEIAARQAELKDAYGQVETTRAQIADQQQATAVLLEAKNEEVQKISGELSEAEQIQQEYEQEVAAQNEVLAAIQAEIARQAAEEEARRKAAEEAARKRAEEEAARKKAEEEAAAAESASEDDEDGYDDEEYEDDEDYEYEDDYTESASASASGFIWPCPSSHRITSEYGPRTAPTAGASSNHKGIDIGAASGSAIVAAQSGTVVTACYSSSAGNMVIISHGKNANGQLVCSVYMHASALYVSSGQKVSQGQKIAAVGSTGYSTGPHLHFAVTVGGDYVNPHGYV